MQTQCPLCNKNAELSFKTKDWNRKISQETFNYRQCSDCGLIFLSNIPDNLDTYYGDTYYCPPSFEKLKKVAKAESYQLAMILQFVKGGRLLEVGPGFGNVPKSIGARYLALAFFDSLLACIHFTPIIVVGTPPNNTTYDRGLTSTARNINNGKGVVLTSKSSDEEAYFFSNQ